MIKKLLTVLLALFILIPNNPVLAEEIIQVEFEEKNTGPYYVGDTVELKINLKLNRKPSEFKTMFFTFDISEGLTYQSTKLESPGIDQNAGEIVARPNQDGIQRFINVNFKEPELLGDTKEFSIVYTAKVNNKKAEGDYLNNRVIAHYQLKDGRLSNNIQETYKSKFPVSYNKPANNELVDNIEIKDEENISNNIEVNNPVPETVEPVIEVHEPFMNGYPGTNLFKPNGEITRAEISAIISRIIEGGEVAKGSSSFNDVDDWRWYGKYVAHMEREEIITGHGDGSFRPQESISRAELATIITRALNLEERNEINFSDVKEVYWARENIEKVVKAGIMTGYPDGTFRPYNKVTRAEAATTINRALGRSPDKEYIDSNNITGFSDIKNHWAYYNIVEASYRHTALMTNDGEKYQ